MLAVGTVTTLMVLAPPDVSVPLKLQVTSEPALLHDHPVPLAETSDKPDGSWSFTCALVATVVLWLVTVSR